MARSLYGGTDKDFFTPGGTSSTSVYLPDLATVVTDLRAVSWSAGTPAVGAAQTAVVGDSQRYYAFYGPDGYTGPLYAPKAYLASGAPNWTVGALRLDPNPQGVYAPIGTTGGSTVTLTDNGDQSATLTVTS